MASAQRMPHKALAATVAGVLALLAAGAEAAELGNARILSRLGQALNVEIEIRGLKPGEEKTLSSRLAPRAAYRRAGVDYDPVVAAVSATIVRRAGRPVLRLRSSRAINEPFVSVLVELRPSAGRETRPYTLLLDPIGYRPPSPVAKAKPASKPKPAPVPPPAPAPQPDGAKVEPVPPSREALFGDPSRVSTTQAETRPVTWRGFVQNTMAYDYRDPSHWSRAVVRTQLGAQGGSGNLKWKASARLDLDPVYAGSNFYPAEVRNDQKRDFFLRETYVDTAVGGVDLRVGKQNIVWGEMVGLFFADVVSARDQRDFILPEFEIIRIPQWALRAERFGDNSHAEVVWLPSPEVDIIGRPGAEFYPFQIPPPAGFVQQFGRQERPSRTLRNSNLGLRLSTLRAGWDLSGFYYRSTDVNPTFYRDVAPGPAPTLVYTPRHDRIWQLGTTLGKDMGFTVAKAEAIYTAGRRFNVTRLAEPGGVVAQDTLDYVFGFDFTLPRDARLNLQYFDRVFFDHDPDLVHEPHERGISILLAGKLGASLEPELLLIRSLNRSDRLVRTRLAWIPRQNWRLTFGVDVFSGEPTGFFGRFADRDRVYLDTRFDF
jgi:hypothetical protein